MTGQRADPDDTARHRNTAQLGEFADIDDEFGRDQAQIHRGHQALAARQHLRPVAMRFEQLQRIHHAGCACVSESRGFHLAWPPRACWRIFFGLDGDACQRSSLFIERLFLVTGLPDLS